MLCCAHNWRMASASSLLANASVPLRLLAGAPDEATVTGVVAVEFLDRLGKAAPSSIVVVSESAATQAASYELDVAIRHATERRLGALVLVGRTDLPVTSRSLAARAGVPILSAPAGIDVADLVLRVDRIVRGGAADILARIETAVEAIRRADGAGVDEIVHDASTALAVPLAYVADPHSNPRPGAGTITVRGVTVGSVAPVSPAAPDEACRVVMPILVATIERVLAADFADRYAPVASRAELIAQLLVAERSHLAPLMLQARELAFPVERTHIAISMQTRDDDVRTRREALDAAELVTLQELPRPGDEWNVTRAVGTLVIIRSSVHDSPQAQRLARRDIERALGRLPEEVRGRLLVGVGTPHAGIEGLRQSAGEAESAATAAGDGGIAVFDAAGVERIIADLAVSPLSRQMFTEIWRPLEQVGAAKAARLVETLAVYLDEQSSPRAAAARLHLHPNAVAYRVRQAAEILRRDLDDADQRLIVHLACRAWLSGRHRG